MYIRTILKFIHAQPFLRSNVTKIFRLGAFVSSHAFIIIVIIIEKAVIMF